jgi:pyruvate,water dikinase
LHDETARLLVCWPAGLARLALLEVGRRLVSQGRLHDAVHMVEARPDQVAPLLHGSADAPTADELRAEYLQRTDLAGLDTPPYVGPPPVPAPYHLMPDAVRRVGTAVEAYLALADARVTRPVEGAPGRTQEAVERVSGLPVNAGIYEGRACLVTGPGDFGRLRQGDVLVARVTSPAYDVVLPLLGAAVTDRGGVLCHTAIVAREFGIPAVVGCGDATRRIPHGARVRVDGATGEVVILG